MIVKDRRRISRIILMEAKMDRVRLKDIVELVDYERKGLGWIVLIDPDGGEAQIRTDSDLLDIMSGFTVGELKGRGTSVAVTLLQEDIDTLMKWRPQT